MIYSYQFIVHDDATADLQIIIGENREAGLQLAKLVQQLRTDQDLLDRLTQHDYGGSPARPRPKSAKFNVKEWTAAQQLGMNLWRMRFFDDLVEGYRLIYAFLSSEHTYVLLGVAEKGDQSDESDERFDYEINHEIAVRITAAYQRLIDDGW